MAATSIQTFAGNIGIGTNDPGTDKLFVNGSLKTNSLTVNGVTNAQVPIGTIVMWHSSVASAPTGWVFCDGTTDILRTDGAGTSDAPDLRSKFIRFAQGDAPATPNFNQTGGANDVTLSVPQFPAHTHPGSSVGQAGNHTHQATLTGGQHAHPGSSQSSNHSHFANTTYIVAYTEHSRVAQGYYPTSSRNDTADIWQNYFVGSDPDLVRESLQHRHDVYIQDSGGHTHGVQVGQTAQHSHTLDLQAQGPHTHTVAVASDGSGDSFSVLPSYHTLVYIMKI